MQILANQSFKTPIFIFFCYFCTSCGTNIRAVSTNFTLRKKHNISVSFKKLKAQRHLKRFHKTPINTSSSTPADYIIEEVKSYLGTPYKYGGNSRTGIDCSALIINVFEPYAITLPRISSEQAQEGTFIPKDRVQKGDLLFFATGRSRKKINHVGIVLNVEDDDMAFIHASSSSGVTISRLKETYWKRRFVTARRILLEKLIGLIQYDYPLQEFNLSSQEDTIFDQ
ncbi:MAG: C40 family peptidase [Flavobacteriales bacterium]